MARENRQNLKKLHKSRVIQKYKKMRKGQREAKIRKRDINEEKKGEGEKETKKKIMFLIEEG